MSLPEEALPRRETLSAIIRAATVPTGIVDDLDVARMREAGVLVPLRDLGEPAIRGDVVATLRARVTRARTKHARKR